MSYVVLQNRCLAPLTVWQKKIKYHQVCGILYYIRRSSEEPTTTKLAVSWLNVAMYRVWTYFRGKKTCKICRLSFVIPIIFPRKKKSLQYLVLIRIFMVLSTNCYRTIMAPVGTKKKAHALCLEVWSTNFFSYAVVFSGQNVHFWPTKIFPYMVLSTIQCWARTIIVTTLYGYVLALLLCILLQPSMLYKDFQWAFLRQCLQALLLSADDSHGLEAGHVVPGGLAALQLAEDSIKQLLSDKKSPQQLHSNSHETLTCLEDRVSTKMGKLLTCLSDAVIDGKENDCACWKYRIFGGGFRI